MADSVVPGLVLCNMGDLEYEPDSVALEVFDEMSKAMVVKKEPYLLEQKGVALDLAGEVCGTVGDVGVGNKGLAGEDD
ncbi:hypothetical protein M569_01581 [Genlisea aurea]|uniref:Uncharacterized protein n=1 Tax=Genlisea aurea TaxID=192259 RepID=S8D073_9LAMI|nr:hypothetical protein M569_01581 [Genlisea aurea]